MLGFTPRVLFDGPIDTTMPDGIADDLLATIGEALTNVARHALASRVDVAVTVGDLVTLTVTDDGVGPPASDTAAGRGLANLAARAERHGGTLRLAAGPDGGTVLTWQVPAPATPPPIS